MPKVLAPGENRAVDAALVVGPHLLLIRRGDGLGWALPGGMVDPGERDEVAVLRELREETNAVLHEPVRWLGDRRPVDDPRAEAGRSWVTTRVALFVLDDEPDVVAGDDAAEAVWVPVEKAELVDWWLEMRTGTGLFAAHLPLVADVVAAVTR